ncbi:MAG: GntR family transcriptional regulator [Myxococcaceae bacterium]
MFSPIEKADSAEKVERMLADEILNGELRPGDLLPPLPDLCLALGLSRNTVRQGIARLVVRGLVVVRVGHGTRVTDLLGSATIDTLIELVLRCRDQERRTAVLQQILEIVGSALIEMVERACTRHTPEHLEWYAHFIRVLANRMDMRFSAPEVRRSEIEIFRVLAGAAENIGFTGLLNSLRRLVDGPAKDGAGSLLPLELHWQLFELVRSRDAEAARSLISKELEARRARWVQELAGAPGTESSPSPAGPETPPIPKP